jgi:hypothetical protein
MKILPGEQLSAAWLQHHVGRVTGSNMASIVGTTATGRPTAKRAAYYRMKLGEMLTGMVNQDTYVSRDMLLGLEHEPLARAAYEVEENVMVEEVGFAIHDTVKGLGGSVDGVVLDPRVPGPPRGMVEIKCPRPGTHAQWMRERRIPEMHVPQINTYLEVMDLEWCDFVSFSPFVPKEMRTFIVRQERDLVAGAKIRQATADFIGELNDAIADLRSMVGDFALPAALASFEETGDLFTPEEEERLGITDDDIRAAEPTWGV